MTVDELLGKLNAAFPAFNARALEAWGGVFRDALGRHEGPALKAAYTAVLGSFTPAKSKALHPMVADFLPFLPGSHPKLPSAGPVLNFKSRDERAQQLLRDWWEAQGKRAAGDNDAIKRALMFMVGPLAEMWGWSANPKPIRLSVKQVRTVQQRAISQQRIAEFGALPRDAGVWWGQISEIADRWKIRTAREEWTSDRPEVIK